MVHSHRRVPIVVAAMAFAILTFASWNIAASHSPVSGHQPLSLKRNVPDEDRRDFMKAKLGAINSAMEAASTDNFAAVERAGLDLMQLSKQAAWNQHANAAYLQDTADFVESAEFMVRMAHAKDSLGVASSFGAVAASCLNCHRHVRTPKVAVNFDQSFLVVAIAELHSPVSR